MSRTGIFPALLVLTLSLCLASSAEARKRSWSYYGNGFSVQFDVDRKTRAEGRRTHMDGRGSRAEDRSTRAVQSAEPTAAKTGGGFGAAIDRLVLGCRHHAAELQRWPFEPISRIASPDEAQRGALEKLRAAVAATEERLSSECPREMPAAPWTRLDAVEQAIEAATSAFAALEPSLQGFYGALDDEQKARLLRDLTLSPAQEAAAERPPERRQQREGRTTNGTSNAATVSPWAGICEDLTAALRSWPISEIERGVRLSEPQRIALYELVTASLKAAETLASACPAETPLTPVRRLAVLRMHLAAVRQATTAINPTLTRFYETLDEGQRAKFAELR